jgi:p-cumate 2,3-dioxygenase subunit beta
VSFATVDRADKSLRRRVEDFLITEAELLDRWQLNEWLELFADDCKYIVPTTDLPDGNPEYDLVFVDDNLVQLRGRVLRLNSRHAHREYPSSRTRRFVSNIRVSEIEADGSSVEVRANFIVYRFRAGSTAPFVGEYHYRLRLVDGDFKIVYRRATLDNETLRDQGAVSIIL